MKKFLSLVLVLALSASILTGCGKTENKETETKTENKTETGTNENKEPATNTDNDKVLLTVGDKTMTKADANIYLYSAKLNVERMGMGPTIWVNEIEPGKTFEAAQLEQLKNTLSYVNILNLEAQKRNLAMDKEEEEKSVAEVKQIIETLPAEIKEYYGFTEESFLKFFKEQSLIQKVFEDEMKDFKVDESKLKTLYEADQRYQKMEEIGVDHYFDRVRARHILISTLDGERNPLPEDKKAEAKKKAEELLKKAKAGEDFATLATENSEDPGSKDKGGEYIFGYGEMVPEFEKAAFELEVGGISDLVETSYGYHIIKLEERIPASAEDKKKAEDQKKQIIESYEEQLKAEEFQVRYDELAKNYEVKFDDALFETLSLSYTVPSPAKEQ